MNFIEGFILIDSVTIYIMEKLESGNVHVLQVVF